MQHNEKTEQWIYCGIHATQKICDPSSKNIRDSSFQVLAARASIQRKRLYYS